MSKPLIGVNCNLKPHLGEQGVFNLDRSYTNAVYQTGGLPQIIPLLPLEEISPLLDLYDGLLLTGGGGLLPHVKLLDTLPCLREQNPLRHEFDLELVQQAMERKMPILGLCRGHQTINDARGGSVQNLTNKNHLQKESGDQVSHDIVVEPQSVLFDCAKSEKISVNSFHSQVIDQLGVGLKVTSTSTDGFIESIEGTDSPFLMGVQFHPEFMMNRKEMFNIYQSFIEASVAYKSDKR